MDTAGTAAPCEQFVPGPPRACGLVRCCSSPDLPSPAEYEARLRNPRAICPHPEGDRWAGCEVEPLPAPRLEPSVTGVVARVRARLAVCRACAHFSRPLGCGAMDGDGSSGEAPRPAALGAAIARAEWACPVGRFEADMDSGGRENDGVEAVA